MAMAHAGGGGGAAEMVEEPVTESNGGIDGLYAPDANSTPKEDRRAFVRCCLILAALILLLVTHKQTETWLGQLFHTPLTLPDGAVVHAANGAVIYGLREGTMMVAAALIMGSVVLLLEREKARELVERRVDWWTLSFFMMLFASVGTLQDTGVTEVIAARISGIGGGHMLVIQLIGWATGWLSAFLDNVLAVATFMPVVHDIRVKAAVPYSSAIYWFMLFGGTFMGNMTIIGSTANIVACGLLERRGHGTVKFGYWMKIGFVVAVASMVVATLLLQVQAHFLPLMQPPPPGSG
jgi:di/tricarboxylate transporter